MQALSLLFVELFGFGAAGPWLDEAVALETRASLATRAGWVPLPAAVRRRNLLRQPGWATSLLGSARDGKLVGFAEMLIADDAPSVGWVFDPDHQLSGVGTRLLSAAQDELARGGAVEIISRAYRAQRSSIDSLAEGFAAAHGFLVASIETVLEIDLATAKTGPWPVPPEYTIATFINGVPAPLITAVGALMGRVDAEGVCCTIR